MGRLTTVLSFMITFLTFNLFFACLQFVVQMGKSKMNSDPSDEIGRFKDTGLMVS